MAKHVFCTLLQCGQRFRNVHRTNTPHFQICKQAEHLQLATYADVIYTRYTGVVLFAAAAMYSKARSGKRSLSNLLWVYGKLVLLFSTVPLWSLSLFSSSLYSVSWSSSSLFILSCYGLLSKTLRYLTLRLLLHFIRFFSLFYVSTDFWFLFVKSFASLLLLIKNY